MLNRTAALSLAAVLSGCAGSTAGMKPGDVHQCEQTYAVALENAVWYPGDPARYHLDHDAALGAAYDFAACVGGDL